MNRTNQQVDLTAELARAAKKDRFVSLKGKRPEVDWALVERARQLTGINGYVTNRPQETMSGHDVVPAYHDLWKVEQSLRTSKSDLRARPILHHARGSIEAHLTIVFTALVWLNP